MELQRSRHATFRSQRYPIRRAELPPREKLLPFGWPQTFQLSNGLV
jgi:hypothetical protein